MTEKQRAWIDYYLVCLNATEAARLAGYKWPNKVGPDNKQKFADVIDKRLGELAMTANETLKRVSDIAASDMLTYIDSRGNLDIEAMRDAGMGRLLKKYKKTKRTIPRKNQEPIEIEQIEVELYGADSAHDKLMRYHGLYNDSTRIMSWKDDIVQALIDGRLKPDDVKLAYADSPDLIAEFFKQANVST